MVGRFEYNRMTNNKMGWKDKKENEMENYISPSYLII